MSTSARVDAWALLPASMKSAGLVALTTLFLAGAMLYQDNVTSEQPPDFSRGGSFAGDMANPAPEEIVVATATPIPKGESRSAATLRARRSITDDAVQGPPFPAIGRYVFAVDGTESASLFGSRAYPPEMTMTVHRRAPGDSTDPGLEPDELAFDLDFSTEHQEREIVAFRAEGIMFTFEARSVTIGPGTEVSETTYEPPITQIPIPLVEDASAEGTSRAISAVDGSQVRTDDWTVEVTGREQVEIMGTDVDTFVIQVDQRSQPGSSEQFTRSRKYWLDPLRAIWVKWEEHVSGRQDVGLGSFTYTTNFTATLNRIEPL